MLFYVEYKVQYKLNRKKKKTYWQPKDLDVLTKQRVT